MKQLKPLIIAISFLMQFSAFAQVQVDHSIQLTGSGVNARVTGIDSVGSSEDAVSVKTLQNGSFIYAVATGNSNNFNITINPPISGYQAGMVFNFISNQNVSGAATLNVNNLGGIPITKYINQSLGQCDIQNGQAVTVVYDGTNFQMTSVSVPLIPASPGAISGTDSVCPYATGVVYSINPVNGATSYNWTVPDSDTIIANTGTSITVDFGANPAGNIAVSATGSCATSTTTALAVVLGSCFIVTAPGATMTDSGGYVYYTFSDTGTFTFSVNGNNNINILIVAGGGGGGGNGGGGGGGGGVIYQSNYFVSTGNYTVTVGAGGIGEANQAANNGENSSFGTFVAFGGGGGGSRSGQINGSNGGSGGGGGGASTTGGSGTAGQGNNAGGGYNNLCASAGGGGGGAGGVGTAGQNELGGNGGNGVSYFGNTYGGGGGGGVTCAPGTGGTGGTGGGGAGSATDTINNGTGNNGTNGLGGGGGGGCNTNTAGSTSGNGLGGNGGSGIVIISYVQ